MELGKSSLLLLMSILHFNFSYAAIHGEDERFLVNKKESSLHYKYVRAVAAQLREPLLKENGRLNIQWKSLQKHVNLCADQRFAQLPTFSRCTGFLVAPDLLVTAGHCVNDEKDCRERQWVFTSEMNWKSEALFVKESETFRCKKIISRKKNQFSKNDYALIQIDKTFPSRPHLNFRREGKVGIDAKTIVIGHPTGLPLMVAAVGEILENKSLFLFKTNHDTFFGNSGSPVINTETGLVEGILTDGELDYYKPEGKNCLVNKLCSHRGDDCKKENVVRITVIPELAPGMTPAEPVFDPNRPIQL